MINWMIEIYQIPHKSTRERKKGEDKEKGWYLKRERGRKFWSIREKNISSIVNNKSNEPEKVHLACSINSKGVKVKL